MTLKRKDDATTAARLDRAARFLARLDDHLPELAGHASRRAFLDGQLEGWERRYARFISTEGASEPVVDPADPLQAADFLLTITGLAARRAAHTAGEDARQRPDGDTRGDHG
jgi:hypothetical protein